MKVQAAKEEFCWDAFLRLGVASELFKPNLNLTCDLIFVVVRDSILCGTIDYGVFCFVAQDKKKI